MAVTLNRLRFLQRELEVYGEPFESWKADHRIAQLCFDFEEQVIALGIYLLDRILQLDEDWRSGVLSGQIEYSADIDQGIQDLFRKWFETTERSLELLASFEQQGFHVKDAGEYRRRFHEVRAVLTPDREFFTAETLTPLREQALEEHSQGRTVEMRSLNN